MNVWTHTFAKVRANLTESPTRPEKGDVWIWQSGEKIRLISSETVRPNDADVFVPIRILASH